MKLNELMLVVVVAVSLSTAAVISEQNTSEKFMDMLSHSFVHDGNCSQSDAVLSVKKEIWCASIVGWSCAWCPSPQNLSNLVHKDWPSQVVYFGDILTQLNSTSKECLAKSNVVSSTVGWLNNVQSNITLGGTLLQTWASPDGQPNYFEMPRHQGERIESPWTLGLKCWAFAFLSFSWSAQELGQLQNHLLTANSSFSIELFSNQYQAAGPFALQLCRRVLANCFQNSTYDPQRNGTCPLSIDFFHGGFDFANLAHSKSIPYPFHP